MEFILNDSAISWPDSSKSSHQSNSPKDFLKSPSPSPSNLSLKSNSSSIQEEEMNEYLAAKFIDKAKPSESAIKKIISSHKSESNTTTHTKTLLKSRTSFEPPSSQKETKIKEIKRTSGDLEIKPLIIKSQDFEQDPMIIEMQNRVKEFKIETERIIENQEIKLKERNQEKVNSRKIELNEQLRCVTSFDYVNENIGKNEIYEFEGRIQEILRSLQSIGNELSCKVEDICINYESSRKDMSLNLIEKERYLDSIDKKIRLEKRLERIFSLSLSKHEKYLREFYQEELSLIKKQSKLSKDSHRNFVDTLKKSTHDYLVMINETREKQIILNHSLKQKYIDREHKLREIGQVYQDSLKIFKECMSSLYTEDKYINELKSKLVKLQEKFNSPKKSYDERLSHIKIKELEIKNLENINKSMKENIKSLEVEIHEIEKVKILANQQIPHKNIWISKLKLELDDQLYRIRLNEIQISNFIEREKNFRSMCANELKNTENEINSLENFYETCEIFEGFGVTFEKLEEYKEMINEKRENCQSVIEEE